MTMVCSHLATILTIPLYNTYSFTAAMFAIPVAATVVGDTFELCVTMTTAPPHATIASEVMVSISAIDGTGKDEYSINRLSSVVIFSVHQYR